MTDHDDHTHDDDQPAAVEQGLPRLADYLRFLSEPQYREVDHHAESAKSLHAFRATIGPMLSELLYAMHDTRLIGTGEQWTIPLGLSCGFEGELVLRIKDAGPDHEAARQARTDQ